MKTAKTISIATCLLIAAITTAAQVPRRRGVRRPTPPKPAVTAPGLPTAPESAPTPAPVVAPMAPVLLATLNGQNITTADIEPQVRQMAEGLEGRIAEARAQILEMEINTLLLASEAAKRRMSPQQFYDLEVTRKITNPAPAEVAKFIQENGGELGSLNQANPEATRKQVVEYLRGEREAAISEALVKRLRASTAVVKTSLAGAPNPASTAVLATVAGRAITAGTINERLKPIVYNLRMSTYVPQRQAVEQTINNLLLLAEANRLNVAPEDIVRKEITEKLRLPTEVEVAKFFAENKANLKGDLDAMRNQIARYLQDQEERRLETEFSARLRQGANIRLFISEPARPAQAVSVDDDPTRGPATAAVTVVEFTDFQCPSCAAMHPVLEEVLQSYGARVRFAVRDYPLAQHAQARKAAEAANAAHAQGKFFEYAALLFKRQNALDVPSLKKYATELGLDRVRFDAALDGGKFAAEVSHDIAEANLYGVGSTPTIFINGIALQELTAEALRAAIDRALANSNSAPKASAK